MKYIEPPTKRRPQKVGKIHPKKPKEHFWIRLLLALGTIGLIIVLSQIFK